MTADKILKKYEDDNEYHFHAVDRKWIIAAMEEYATLRQPLVVGRSEQFYCASDKDNRYERCEDQCHICKMEY